MEDIINQLAVAFQAGNHTEVAYGLKKIELECSLNQLKHCFYFLQRPSEGDTGLVYVHFITLKSLRFFLVRDRCEWVDNGLEILGMLFSYAQLITQSSVIPCTTSHTHWRPLYTELATTIAIVFKMCCVGSSSAPPFLISNVVEVLMMLLHNASINMCALPGSVSWQASETQSGIVLRRSIVQRTIEEFGLFDAASKRRGLPIHVHIYWRKQMEDHGLQPVTAFFFQLLLQPSSSESSATTHVAVSVLLSCLSWFKYCFLDTEVDSPDEETTDTFKVRGEWWKKLLLGSEGRPPLACILGDRFDSIMGASQESCGTSESGFASLGSSTVKSKILHNIVLCIRLLCSFTIVDSILDENDRFVYAHFSLCIRMVTSWAGVLSDAASINVDSCQFTALWDTLPVVCSGIRRLIINFPSFFVTPASQVVLNEFSVATAFLLSVDRSQLEDDEKYIGAVEEILSGWLSLAFMVERSVDDVCIEPFFHVAQNFLKVFELETFLQKAPPLSCCDEDKINENDRIELLLQTCIHMAGRIARVDPCSSCTMFQAALQELGTVLTDSSGFNCKRLHLIAHERGNSLTFAVKRVTGILLGLLPSFLGDPSDGEEACIPSCFLDLNTAEANVLPLINTIICFFDTVLTASTAFNASPETFLVYGEVLERFFTVYVDTEDTITPYVEMFSKGQEILLYGFNVAVEFFKRFPSFSRNKTMCRMLYTVLDKSRNLHLALTSYPVFTALLDIVKNEDSPLGATTRGRLTACIATYVTPIELFAAIPQLPALMSSTCPREKFVYHADFLIGMCEFILRTDVIHTQFSSFLGVVQRLLTDCFQHLEYRGGMISALKLSFTVFTVFAGVLDDQAVTHLLVLVKTSLDMGTASLSNCKAWYESKEGLHDRQEMILGMALLVDKICLWKELECFFSGNEIEPAEKSTVDTLVFLLETVTMEDRQIPEIESALFSCVDHCSAAFTSSFVFHPKSYILMTAMMDAIRHETDAVIHRCGTNAILAVSRFLYGNRDSGTWEDICSKFYTEILLAMMHPRSRFCGMRHLCKTLLKLSRMLSSDRMRAAFESVLNTHPSLKPNLSDIYSGLERTSEFYPSEKEAAKALTYFCEIVEGATVSLEGISMNGY